MRLSNTPQISCAWSLFFKCFIQPMKIELVFTRSRNCLRKSTTLTGVFDQFWWMQVARNITLLPSKVCKYYFKVKLRGLTGKKYFSSRNLVKPSQYKDSLTNVLADVCRQIALMQRFTLFTFSTRTQNCQFGDLFKIISPTTFPIVSGIFKNSIKGQLATRELPRTRALLEIFCGSLGAPDHGKDLKIRSTAFLFTLSLPLCLCVLKFLLIFASRLPSKISTSAQIKRKFSAPKDRTNVALIGS